MSTSLPVTTSQTDAICKMANEKKVGRERFQKALDDGSMSRFLDSFKTDVSIVPPKRARIHVLRVKVTLDQSWQEAVNAAGPNTPSDYNVRKVGDLYLPSGIGEEEQEHILLNYPNGGGNWNKALAWADEKRLKRTVPREVFAIGKQYPTLHEELGQNPMYLAATTECTFEGVRQASCVWWCGSKRLAGLDWVERFGRTLAWFAFRR